MPACVERLLDLAIDGGRLPAMPMNASLLAMNALRVAIVAALLVLDRVPIMDAVRGRPNVFSVIALAIIVALLAQVVWSLRKLRV